MTGEEERWRTFDWLTNVVDLLRDDVYQAFFFKTVGYRSCGRQFIRQLTDVVYQGA